MKTTMLALWVTALSGAGCVGRIGDRADDGSVEPPPSSSTSCQSVAGGPAPLRRLTREEYNNTVAALLGDDTHPADGFLPDEWHGPFRQNLGVVSDVAVAQYADAASALADRAVAQRLGELSPCGASPSEPSACLEEFIAEFGRRALRRPLLESEVAAYASLAKWQLGRGDFASAVRLTIETMLQSVHFLYHVVQREADGRLTPHSIATRLAFAVTRTTPDVQLLEAADANAFEDRAVVEAEVRRLLDSDAGRETLVSFHAQLLGLEQLEDLAGEGVTDQDYDAATLAAMRRETETFVHEVLQESGRLDELLTATHSYADPTVAALYGLPAPDLEWQRVELDPAQRAGFLTQPSAMALRRSPVRRGLFVDETLLCGKIPPPPPSVDTTPPEPIEGVPPRERWLAHVTDPACAGCHQLLDPVGFAFDHYDAFGRWQDQKGGYPVDASGTVELIEGAPAFGDAVELAALLAQSDELHECMSQQWLAFALGRPRDPLDACLEDESYVAFQASGFDVRELFVSIVTSERFLHASEGDAP